MKILNLHMGVRWGPRVHWLDEQMNRYSVPLETKGGGHFGGGEVVRPFRVKLAKPMGHKVAKRYGTRQTPESTPKNNQRASRFDTEAKAHAAVVAEALRRAEEEGLYEKALAGEEQRERDEEDKARAKELQDLRDCLEPLLEHKDPAISQRALMLHAGPDEALLEIARALR